MKKSELYINKKLSLMFKVLLIITMAMLIVISVSGCNPGTRVPFEIINDLTIMQDSGGTYPDAEARIFVVDNLDLVPKEAFEWVIYESEKTNILSVDYSQYFVLLLLNGYRNSWSSFFKVTQIRENDNKIIIIADFDDLEDGPFLWSESSQYQIVKTKRTDIKASGEILFSLIDEDQKERASTSYVITK